MNEKSNDKSKDKKDKLIEDDDIINIKGPLLKEAKINKENAMVFNVFIPNNKEGEKYKVMSFTKNKKKSNKV